VDPADAFATTYFLGFVKLICQALEAGREIRVGNETLRGKASRGLRLNIALPPNLSITVKTRTRRAARRIGLREALVSCPDRTRTLFMLPSGLALMDMPSVLDTIPHTHPPALTAAERRLANWSALERFRQQLNRFIASDPLTRGYATVRRWEWLEALPVSFMPKE
jgi:hypothetical protein